MAIIIARHCVAKDSTTGLSPLQTALLESAERVRIADAPTGAGKSYAFQKAVASGQRVLFIVPTRRLAQNLAADLIRNLIVHEKWPVDQAEAKVKVWSSDQSTGLRGQNVENISGYRIRQWQSLDQTREGGEMIVAIPEVVSHLLLQRRMDTGQAAAGIFDVLDFFNHIVFDEFHTIEARGFGLAALCARLVSVENPDGSIFGRAKLSFLSATPLDIRPVLKRLGVPDAAIASLRETLTQDGRALHGDVVLSFTDQPSLAELVSEHLDVVSTEVGEGRQVVIIYNKLGDLERELPVLAHNFAAIDIDPARVLVINSIRDSGSNGVSSVGFRVGRKQNPDEFSVLIATASVEMGVTFREANVMFMEPGFFPMNFLQRYGRAARRGEDGQVWVRYEKAMSARSPWLRSLLDWAKTHDSECLGIEDLSEQLSAETRKEFKDTGDDDSRYFGKLPNRAVYTAGLYWNALMKHPSNEGPRRGHLLAHRPTSATHIYAWLKQVRGMEEDRYFGASAKAWCDLFEKQAYTLRDIDKRLRVVQRDGAIEVSPLWLERETTVLEELPIVSGEDGREEVRLNGYLDKYLRDQRKAVNRMVTVCFPHTSQTAQLPAGDGLVDAWCRNLRGRSGPEGVAWDDYPEAMAAAEKLVRNTGLVPRNDDSLSMAASSGVL